MVTVATKFPDIMTTKYEDIHWSKFLVLMTVPTLGADATFLSREEIKAPDPT